MESFIRYDETMHTKDGATRWFNQEWIKEQPGEDNVFELGLSLGGTVSAGAYTAGVLDFLIEALEEWETAKASETKLAQDRKTVPWHKVRIKVIAGASGGGVCAAALAKALAYPFPHVANPRSEKTPEGSSFQAFSPSANAEHNPLYRLWISNFDIDGFCETTDSESASNALSSLLNPAPLLRGCHLVASYPESKQGIAALAQSRPYIAEPLTFFVTLSNLSGVPYKATYSGNAGRYQMYRKHADYARFECYYQSYKPRESSHTFDRSWPDAFCVSHRPTDEMPEEHRARFVQWDTVALYARATGAFPVGFPAVQLTRPAWHYLYQPVFLPGDNSSKFPRTTANILEPAWDAWSQSATASYSFISVDGGAFNNQPAELARRHLAGTEGSNPRSAENAHRAVIVIDPFTDEIPPGPQEVPSALGAVSQLALAWLSQSRYGTQDFVLATDNKIRSRFLLSAVREVEGQPSVFGNEALACAPLSAFGGFLHHDYREHDYLLGRRNCQQFLKNWLLLSRNNPVFQNCLPSNHRGGDTEIPIIPLLGNANAEQLLAPWPTDSLRLAWPQRQCDTPTVESQIKNRVDEIVSRASRSFGLSERLKVALGFVLKRPIGEVATGKLIHYMRDSLRQAGLDKPWWWK